MPYIKFLRTGTVCDNQPSARASRWPPEVVEEVQEYVSAQPTFYIEELKLHLKQQFPDLQNTSESTICRALNFDLQLTQKKLTKAAREALPEEIKTSPKIEAHLKLSRAACFY